MRMRHRRSQSGFTLLEVLLAIGISLTIGAVALTEMRRDNESKQARAVGQQLAAVGNALNTYMALHYDRIIDLEDQPGPGPGTVDDPAPRYCTANVATIDSNPVALCTVTVETLVRSGTLPRNFSGRNAFGAGYDLYIRVIGTGSNPIVDGLAMVNQPYTTGGAVPRYDLMGQAMQEAGADSAMTRTVANSMEGLNGTWRDDVWPGITHGGDVYTGVNRLGLLGFRAGYGSSAYAAFLRRDGTLEMTGDLNMDDHHIENVNGMDAKFVRISRPDPDPVTGISSGESLTLNSIDGAEDTRTAFVTGDGTMAIRNRDGVTIQDLGGNPGAFAAGEITGVGNMSINGDITASGNIQALDIRGRSAELDENLIVRLGLQVGPNAGPNVTVTNGTITAAGQITGNSGQFNQGVTVGTGGDQYLLNNQGLARVGSGTSLWWYDNAQSHWRTQESVQVDGDVRATTMRVDDNLQVGNYIDMTGTMGAVVNPGGACTPSGAPGRMRRASSGEVVQCLVGPSGAGRWAVMGVRTTVVTSPNITVLSSGVPVTGRIDCPAGTTLVGGGHLLTANPTGSPGGGLDSRSPSTSTPDGNGWMVRTGQDNGVGTSFQARAVCAY